MPRELRLNAFDMATIGHIQHGMWTHPRDRSADYHRLEYWTGLARTLERGLFDGLFLADVLGIYDVLGGDAGAALRQAVQVPLLDPLGGLLEPVQAPAGAAGSRSGPSLAGHRPEPGVRGRLHQAPL